VWDGVIDVIAKSHLFKESVKNAMLDEESHQLSEKEIKSSKKAMRELDRKISKYTESIGNLKADLIMGDNKSELISTIKKLELDREKLQGQRDSTLQSINDSERGRRWVDWVAAFKNRINHLELIVEEVEQKQFIKEVVEKIEVVKGEGDEVKLNIHFTLPYYEDELVYRDLLDKKKGYEIVEGKSTYLIDYTSKKKI
jgi:predicted RNase H-like nuclease (RuvC/YqgF family)